MQKGKKIKRYNNIYGKNPNTPLTYFLSFLKLAAVVGILAFVGWSLYTPVSNFITELNSPPEPLPPSSLPAVDSDPSSTSQESFTPEPAEEIKQKADLSNIMYLEIEDIITPTVLSEKLSTAKNDSVSAISVILKDNNGTVYFPSSEVYAQTALYENLTLYTQGLEQIKSQGFSLVGRIVAFEDANAARQNIDENITYLSSGFNWIDKAPNNGGKQWLNPYSTNAVNYIAALGAEAIEAGIDVVLYESFHFPRGEALETANYGAIATATRENALNSALLTCKEAIEENNGEMYVQTFGVEVLYNIPMMYGVGATTAINSNMWLDLSVIGVVAQNVVGTDTLPVINQILQLTNSLDKTDSIAVLRQSHANIQLSSEQIDLQVSAVNEAGFEQVALIN